MSAVRMNAEVEEDVDLVCRDRPRALLRLGQSDVAPDVAKGLHLLGCTVGKPAEVIAVDLETIAVGERQQLHHEAAHDVRLKIRREIADADFRVAAMIVSHMLQLFFGAEEILIEEVALSQLLITDMRQIVTDQEVIAVKLPLLCEIRCVQNRLAIGGGRFLSALKESQEVTEPAVQEALLPAVKLRPVLFQQPPDAFRPLRPIRPFLQNGELFCNLGKILHRPPSASFFRSTAI